MSSFVENINKLAEKLEIIVESNEILDDKTIPILEEIAKLDLKEAMLDLRKGSYLGNRKIDINLALNRQGITEDLIEKYPEQAEDIWTDLSGVVLYDRCDVTFVDGEVITINFEFDGSPISISTHGDLLIQFSNSTAFMAKLEDTLISGFAWDVVGKIVRLYDVIGQNSNVERIQLHAVSGDYIDQNPIYYWAKTSSAFQTLSMRAGDIIKLGNDIDSIILLANSIKQVLSVAIDLQGANNIGTVADDLNLGVDSNINIVGSNIDIIETTADNIVSVNTVATNLTGVNNILDDIANNYNRILEEVNNRSDAIANIQSQLTGHVPLEASAFSSISWQDQTIDNSVTIPDNKNAWSFGPTITISAGQTVTVGTNSYWTIANGETV